MAEFFDDRRDEPRFHAQGHVKLLHRAGTLEGEVTNLSLNGFRLLVDAADALAEGQRCEANLDLPGTTFSAEVVVVRVGEREVGLEFWNMPPADFAMLTQVLDELRKGAAG